MLKKQLVVVIGLVLLSLLLTGVVVAEVRSPLTNALTMVGPSACPSSGCAAGQRLNFQLNFDVAPVVYDKSNVQVCVYAPQSGGGGTAWVNSASFSIDVTGETTGQSYTAGETASVCTNNLPANNLLLGGAYATLPSGTTSDALGFVFRINTATTVNGAINVSIFEVDSGGTVWTATGVKPSQSINVAAAASPAYVSGDATGCGAFSPCYLNSSDDLDGGIGTGLKDAVDALPPAGTITILGNILTKNNTVVLNAPLTLQGSGNSTLFAGGGDCSGPVLAITAGGTIRNLFINGNACSAPARDLININSSAAVVIESSELAAGNDAIKIDNDAASVIIRYNQISANSGYAVNRVASSGTGSLFIVANNIMNNRAGAAVECNSVGQADHNFWGTGILPTDATSNCTVTNGKRLGAAILHNATTPGLNVHRVTVTQNKQDPFNQGLSLQHNNTQADFDVYTVNHGYGDPNQIPFYGSGTNYLSPCSSFWDIFLAEGVAAPSSLDIYLKYDLNSVCIGLVESSSYCGQTADPAKYPLWWYDPQSNATNGWNTTGQNPDGSGANGAHGQPTSCSISSREISVSLSPGGRPDLSSDLNFTPLVIGTTLPVSFIDFYATATIGQTLLQWETASENNIAGFYVVRSTQPNGVYSRTSDLIDAKGSPIIGGIYSYTDTNLNFGTTYYYKLEIINTSNQTAGFYGPVSASTATATPTVTFTPTITRTPTRTSTPTITKTRTPTNVPTKTRTATTFYIVPTRTRTPFFVASITPTPLSIFTRTSTLSRSGTPGTGTPGTKTPGTATRTTGTPGTPGATEAYPAPGGSLTNTATRAGTDSAYPAPGTGTPKPGTQPAGTGTPALTNATEIASITGTPQPGDGQTNVKPLDASQPSFWISLVGGGILGLALISIIGWFLFQRRLAA